MKEGIGIHYDKSNMNKRQGIWKSDTRIEWTSKEKPCMKNDFEESTKLKFMGNTSNRSVSRGKDIARSLSKVKE